MGVRATSRQAYFTDVQPKLGQKQMQVFEAFQASKRPINDRELSTYLGWPINTITNRRGELVEAGKIIEAFRDIDPNTNRRVIYWKASE